MTSKTIVEKLNHYQNQLLNRSSQPDEFRTISQLRFIVNASIHLLEEFGQMDETRQQLNLQRYTLTQLLKAQFLISQLRISPKQFDFGFFNQYSHTIWVLKSAIGNFLEEVSPKLAQA